MAKILHLSDLHFGFRLAPSKTNPKRRIELPTHRFNKGGIPNPERLVAILTKDPACVEPNLIIASGDIGWSAADKDYAPALKFFRLLNDHWPSARVVLAPGNHDVSRSAPRKTGAQDAFIKMVRTFYGRRFQAVYPLYDYSGPATSPSDRARLIAFDYDQKNEILTVAVNSAAYLTNKSTPVFVDPSALEAVEEHLNKLRLPESTLRIFVLHHHLLPFAEPTWSPAIDQDSPTDEPDPTLVANSAKLQAWLAERSFHVVLHGHKHLSHGRADRLWRRDDPPEGRSLLIIGAGSAGVEEHHRSHEEPLSYNLLSINRLSEKRWSIRVSTQRIAENSIVPSAKPLYTYSTEVGPAPIGIPTSFYAERMDECHGAIKNASDQLGLIRGFVSVVETPKYIHPPSVQIKNKAATSEDVERSFLALHPEYELSERWTRLDELKRTMQNVNPRFRFRHGPRMFGMPGRREPLEFKLPEENLPIIHALETLSTKNISRGYVGMFNAEADVLSEKEPLPGLMSIQFIPDGKNLDLVATFRKIELSFWWAVNMYEMVELLQWAALRKKFLPRRITFFAALAEWKHDPEVIFDAQIDTIKQEQLISYVLDAMTGGPNEGAQARHQLASLLREKANNTSDVHLEVAGLAALRDLMNGLPKTHSIVRVNLNPMPVQEIDAAVNELQRAIEQKGGRQVSINTIRNHLLAAASKLDHTASPLDR